MKTGNVRVSYWAVDPSSGARAEKLAEIEQGPDGRFAAVFTSDPRDVVVSLELRDGEAWREVRARRVSGGAPRVLPGPYDPA